MNANKAPRWFVIFQLILWTFLLGVAAYLIVPSLITAPAAAATLETVELNALVGA